jgi:hypothetical protein
MSKLNSVESQPERKMAIEQSRYAESLSDEREQ